MIHWDAQQYLLSRSHDRRRELASDEGMGPRIWCMSCMSCEGFLEGDVYGNTSGVICRRRFWKSLRSPPQGTHVIKDNRKTVSTVKVLVIRLVDDVLLPGYISKENVNTEHCQYFAVLFVRSPVKYYPHRECRRDRMLMGSCIHARRRFSHPTP